MEATATSYEGSEKLSKLDKTEFIDGLTKSQNGWGWKGALEVTMANPTSSRVS